MKLRIIFPAVVLLILIAMVVLTFQYKVVARTLPLVVGVPLIVLVVIQLVKEMRDKAGEDASSKMNRVSGSTNLIAIGWIASLVLAIYLLGFNIGIPIFSFAYLRAHRQSWLVTIVCTLGIFVMVYFGFGMLMKMDFYEGLFFQ